WLRRFWRSRKSLCTPYSSVVTPQFSAALLEADNGNRQLTTGEGTRSSSNAFLLPLLSFLNLAPACAGCNNLRKWLPAAQLRLRTHPRCANTTASSAGLGSATLCWASRCCWCFC